jgi:membrane-anchored glycerophosphoryl diester phosphodiesterase (GDPDase)
MKVEEKLLIIVVLLFAFVVVTFVTVLSLMILRLCGIV